MPNIIKEKQGLLFDDDFREPNLAWNLSPSNANNIAFTENGLRLRHTGKYVTFTIVEPELDEYACVVEIDHAPYDITDIAGVIILSTNRQYAELQTFMATSESEVGTKYTLEEIFEDANYDLDYIYPRYRIDDGNDAPSGDNPSEDEDEPEQGFVDVQYRYIKMYKKNQTYTFYASADNIKWIEVGNVKFDTSGSIGLFIEKSNNQDVLANSHCYINKFALYSSKYMQINNFPRNASFEIHDNSRILFRSDNPNYNVVQIKDKSIVLNTTSLPMPMDDIFVRFFNEEEYHDTICEYHLEDVYGGDVFTIDTDVRFYYDDTQIMPGEIVNLGLLKVSTSYIRLTIKNEDTLSSVPKILSIERYSDYYSGYKNILMSISDSNEYPENNIYTDTITLPALEPEEVKYLYLWLNKNPEIDNFLAIDFRFKLVIQ